MSVVEKLEEAIKKFPDYKRIGICAREIGEFKDWFENFTKEFVAFKKDYDNEIHVPRKQEEERLRLAKEDFEEHKGDSEMIPYQEWLKGYIKAKEELLEK